MEIKSEILMVIDLLREEIEGVEDYNKMLSHVEDGTLSKIITNITNEEKQHISALAGWVNDKVKTMK
jgi:rubrerythrin